MKDLLQFIQNNFWLVLIALMSGGMLIWPFIRKLVSGGSEVDTFQAIQLINRRDAVVVDLREGSEYAAGHIPNAKHIPVAQLASRLKELEKFKERPIVLTCASGTRSASATGILKKHGFNEVVNLKGGLMAWQQASLPVEKKK